MTYLRSPLETNPTASKESATGFRRLPGHLAALEQFAMVDALVVEYELSSVVGGPVVGEAERGGVWVPEAVTRLLPGCGLRGKAPSRVFARFVWLPQRDVFVDGDCIQLISTSAPSTFVCTNIPLVSLTHA